MDKQTRRIVEQASPEDFDGHTEFARMTADQRLSWLDEANAAYLELHALAKPIHRLAEDNIPYGEQG